MSYVSLFIHYNKALCCPLNVSVMASKFPTGPKKLPLTLILTYCISHPKR